MAAGVLLQDLQGVVGPLAFAVELNVTRQTVILHLVKDPKQSVTIIERDDFFFDGLRGRKNKFLFIYL